MSIQKVHVLGVGEGLIGRHEAGRMCDAADAVGTAVGNLSGVCQLMVLQLAREILPTFNTN